MRDRTLGRHVECSKRAVIHRRKASLHGESDGASGTCYDGIVAARIGRTKLPMRTWNNGTIAETPEFCNLKEFSEKSLKNRFAAEATGWAADAENVGRPGMGVEDRKVAFPLPPEGLAGEQIIQKERSGDAP